VIAGQAGAFQADASPRHVVPFMNSRRSAWLAWAIWATLALVVCIMVARAPDKSTVTPVYRGAAEGFLAGQPIYNTATEGQASKHGWLYPVWSALVYVPFTLPPKVVGEVLWRCVCIGLYAWAILRLSRLVDRTLDHHSAAGGGEADPSSRRRHFLVLTLLTFLAAIGSARNGQMNLPLGAAMLLGAIETHERRWWRATAWLALAIVMKPIAVVLVLLLGALHPALWWRLPIAALVVAALPFLHPNWAYVREQYAAGLAKVVEAGEPGAGTFADLSNVLRTIGVDVPHQIMTAIRGIMAAITLAVCWLATRRLDRTRAIVSIFALGTAYLMLFNPRTEGNSYLIVAPGVAAWAVWTLAGADPDGRARRSADTRLALIAWWLIVSCVLLGIVHLFIPKTGKDRLIRPAVTLVFYAGLGSFILARPRALSAAPAAS